MTAKKKEKRLVYLDLVSIMSRRTAATMAVAAAAGLMVSHCEAAAAVAATAFRPTAGAAAHQHLIVLHSGFSVTPPQPQRKSRYLHEQ